MGLSRRFQNLIVDSPYAGAKWLRSVDLTSQLFGDTETPSSTTGGGAGSALAQETPAAHASDHHKNKRAEAAALRKETIQMSSPIFRFRTDAPNRFALDCFPLSDGKVVIADHTGRAFLCDADKRRVVTMPNLHKQKSQPISLFVPGADEHPGGGGGGGSLYVMERNPNPEKGSQFEAFVCGKSTGTSEGQPWHCRLLPSPSFVYDPADWFTYPNITSYAVVGSDICVSTKCNGTYRLHTASNTWEVVSKGTLPFCGKAEYVPELKLWFGLSAVTRRLAAADLSAMDSRRPQLIGDWKEFDPPKGWMEHQDSLLVNLGSGRFCIVRFFETFSVDGEEVIDRIAVFTGVEVMAPVVHDGNRSGSANGKVQLQMKRHKWRYHVCKERISICDVF